MTARRSRMVREFPTEVEGRPAWKPIPRKGDVFLVDPEKNLVRTVRAVLRENDGLNAGTFTIYDDDRNLGWIRWAGGAHGWVDAILHKDCGGDYGP